MADKVHCIKKTVRLTQEDNKILSQKATQYDMNEAEYIRFLIRQQPNDYPEIRDLLKRLVNEVNHIGVNINQIAYRNNAELYSPKDKDLLIAYMRKLTSLVNEVVVAVGNK